LINILVKFYNIGGNETIEKDDVTTVSNINTTSTMNVIESTLMEKDVYYMIISFSYANIIVISTLISIIITVIMGFFIVIRLKKRQTNHNETNIEIPLDNVTENDESTTF
jgi:energy-converting hydrogenase Eha subunit C